MTVRYEKVKSENACFPAITTALYEESKSMLYCMLNCDNAQVHRSAILSLSACLAHIKTDEERSCLLGKCLEHIDNSYWLVRVRNTKSLLLLQPRLFKAALACLIASAGAEVEDKVLSSKNMQAFVTLLCDNDARVRTEAKQQISRWD